MHGTCIISGNGHLSIVLCLAYFFFFLINHVLYKAFLLKSPSIKGLLIDKFEPTNHAEFQRIARRDKKAFLNDQCKEIKENDRMGKTIDLFNKIRATREHFMQRWAQ